MSTKGNNKGGAFAVLAICAALYMCNRTPDPAATAITSVAPAHASSDIETAEASTDDEDEIGDVGEVKGGETYEQYDSRRDEVATGLYSGGDECTEDCGGHDAGRQWAEQRGISDPSECGGKSWSFEEGCRSYATEQQAAEEATEDET